MPIRISTVYETARRGAHGDQTTNSSVNPLIIQRKIRLGMLDNQGYCNPFLGEEIGELLQGPDVIFLTRDDPTSGPINIQSRRYVI